MSSNHLQNDPRWKIAKGLAVIGSTTIDQNVIDGRRFTQLGGVTTYAGITYRRHGVATRVVTNVATRDQSMLDPLASEGIRIARGETPETTRFINRVEEDRRVQQMPTRASAITPDQAQSALAHVDAVHLGPLHPEDIDPSVYRGLSRARLLVVLDVQGLVRINDKGRVAAGVSDILAGALYAAHIVKSDIHELHTITERYGPDLSSLIQAFNIHEWLVTNGEKGGFVQDGSGAVHPFRAEEVETPRDPTGAGDVFLASYAWARFKRGQSIDSAAGHAARQSAAQVAGRYITLPSFNFVKGD